MKNYILFKCKTCGTEFAVPSVYIDESTNYIGCPKDGRHPQCSVIGAYDNLKECMDHDSYKVVRGVIKQR